MEQVFKVSSNLNMLDGMEDKGVSAILLQGASKRPKLNNCFKQWQTVADKPVAGLGCFIGMA